MGKWNCHLCGDWLSHTQDSVVPVWRCQCYVCPLSGYQIYLLYKIVCFTNVWGCTNFLILILLSDRCKYNHTSAVELIATQSTFGHAREHGPVLVKSVLPVTNANTNLTFECVATNIAGEDRDSFTFKISCKKNVNIPCTIFLHFKWSYLMHL